MLTLRPLQIERDNDPREDYHTHEHDHDDSQERPPLDPLFLHNPFAGDDVDHVPGSFEEHVTQRSGPGGSMQFTRVIIRSRSPRGAQDNAHVSPSPIFESFQRMVQNMIGTQAPTSPDQPNPAPPPPQLGRGYEMGVPTEGSDQAGPPPSDDVTSGEVRLPLFGGRITYSTTTRLLPRDANHPQPPSQPVDDLPK